MAGRFKDTQPNTERPMESLRGKLLIASPQLTEPTFARTVILLIQHNEEGAVGVVLNRTLGQTVEHLWEKISGESCGSDKPVHVGGPVSGPLMALHGIAPLAELKVMGGVFVASSKEVLEKLVAQSDSPFRLYVGHAGWAGGQLEQELAAGVWQVSKASISHVFGDDDDLWESLTKNLGADFLRDVLKIERIPRDVTVN